MTQVERNSNAVDPYPDDAQAVVGDRDEVVRSGDVGDVLRRSVGDRQRSRVVGDALPVHVGDPERQRRRLSLVRLCGGPDGALWFTNTNSIGRITTAGAVTTYTDPALKFPNDITSGPDGALWFTDTTANSIWRVTTTGSFTAFTGSAIDRPNDIVAGPDGALWFTNVFRGDETGFVSRITTDGQSSEIANTVTSYGIAAGPSGTIWFTNWVDNFIGRINVGCGARQC